jgi:hypothetical protein
MLCSTVKPARYAAHGPMPGKCASVRLYVRPLSVCRGFISHALIFLVWAIRPNTSYEHEALLFCLFHSFLLASNSGGSV